MTTQELTPEDLEMARQMLEEFEAERAASPPTSISKEFIDKMTSGIADPDEAERERTSGRGPA